MAWKLQATTRGLLRRDYIRSRCRMDSRTTIFAHEERVEVMDTLREGKTSLLATPTEREHTSARAERMPDSAVVADRMRAAKPVAAPERLVSTATEPISAGYIHPDIPSKSVPYAFAKRAFDIVLATTLPVGS